MKTVRLSGVGCAVLVATILVGASRSAAVAQTLYWVEKFDETGVWPVTAPTDSITCTPSTGTWKVFRVVRYDSTGANPWSPPAFLRLYGNYHSFIVSPTLTLGLKQVQFYGRTAGTNVQLTVYVSTDGGANWQAGQNTQNLTGAWAQCTFTYDLLSDNIKLRLQNNTASNMGIDSLAVLLNDAALPVELSSFAAATSGNGVVLSWATVSETNNLGFFVQRRSEGTREFTELPNVFIPGHGTTLQPQSYTYVDNTVTPGVWFYRLRQVDLDGTVTYTGEVRAVSANGAAEAAPMEFLLQNYPNPFNPTTEIMFSVQVTGKAVLEVYNVMGQKVATAFDGVAETGRYYTVLVDGGGRASGLYFYRLSSGTKSDLKKMMLMK